MLIPLSGEISLAAPRGEGTGGALDGDYAYIENAKMYADARTESGDAVYTGTAPWDTEAPDEKGNDASELDSKVRSFDTVSYTVSFESSVRSDAQYEHYSQGLLYFEFILPVTKEKAVFDEGAMGWLSAKNATYEITDNTYQGQPCQVLKGSFLWKPSDDNPTTIGEGMQTLQAVIRVLAMKEGETLKPLFTFWLEHNQVPESGLVTGSGYQCPVHHVQEYQTIEGTEVRVTSAPRYNVQIRKAAESTNYLGTFNFGTGNDLAQNKDAGERYGRVQAFGVTLQVVGKTKEHGMRGCEIPDGSNITFDLNLSSSYRTTADGSSQDVSETGFAPLLWSSGGNSAMAAQHDERTISVKDNFAFLGAPFNNGGGTATYDTCKSGGTWTSVQEGNTIHVTVSGYDADLTQTPNTDAKNDASDETYYKPGTDYWNRQIACFSAGEFWILQPFYDKEGNYVVHTYGDGGFNVVLSDSGLEATGVSGTTLEPSETNSNQAVTTDDRVAVDMVMESPGTIEQYINYAGTDVTNECWNNGRDWTLSGAEIQIREAISHQNAEGMNTAVAYDDLMKFDDAFFEIDSVSLNTAQTGGVDGMEISFLYGAKPDGKGWDHAGKKPGEEGYDDEMRQATADNLIFFTSLDELKEEGYTCVAVLMEARGVASSGSVELTFTASGNVKNTAVSGDVHMVTHSAKAWNKRDVQQAAAAALKKSESSLTDNDYKAYAQNNFPSRAGKETPQKYEEYPDSFWTNDYASRDGLRTYLKSEYDEDGYVRGTENRNYGDSCLVTGYATTITKHPAQKSQGKDKLTYDLDTSQRVADYVLDLSAERAAGEFSDGTVEKVTTVYVEDELPKGLTYIPRSAYWGGTYQQTAEGKQGKVDISVSGQQIEPDISVNEKGNTVLRWTLENVTITGKQVTEIQPIYYSCEIGRAGDDENDVTNGDNLSNTARIWSKDEPRKDYSLVNENQAVVSISVVKNLSVSLSKLADQSTVETGQGMGFVMNVGNNGGTTMDVIAVDSLPYNGDAAGSVFDGPCLVTEFTIQNLKEQFSGNNFRLYYTTAESERGKGSSDYQKEDFTKAGTVWKELTVNTADGSVTLPEGKFCPVAVAAVGKLAGSQTLKMHVTILLPEGEPGAYAANRLTRDTLESYGRSSVVGRVLEGTVWEDEDQDGIRTDEEPLMDGVTVTLMKLRDGGSPSNPQDYEPYQVNGQDITVTTGKQVNVVTGAETEYTTGGYRFSGLPEGTFGIKFSDGTVKLAEYKASPKDVGGDDTIDSDAQPDYEEDVLTGAFIPGIEMPPKDQINGTVYTSRYHDLGLYQDSVEPVDFTFTKVKAENTDETLNGAEFTLYQLICGDTGHTEDTHNALIDPDALGSCWKEAGKATSSPQVTFKDLLPGEYRLVETKAPAGRVLPSGQWKVVIGEDQKISITCIGTTKPPAFIGSDSGETLLLPNMLPADIPGSGGRGILLFTLAGILLMGGGAVTGFAVRKGRGKSRGGRI